MPLPQPNLYPAFNIVRLSHVELAVTDGCGGIADDARERVFDVGYRGTSSRTPQEPEVLAILRDRAEEVGARRKRPETVELGLHGGVRRYSGVRHLSPLPLAGGAGGGLALTFNVTAGGGRAPTPRPPPADGRGSRSHAACFTVR